MKMMNDLSQAVQGVYNSSREIMKNKQKHLYINMLDLLIRTTRASGVSATMDITEDYIKFWFGDILPLVFDENKSIQDNAITALETILPYLENVRVENLPEWPILKAIIVDQYSKKLHDLRQASNPNWYKIWSLLVRILNKEILKGATVINTFLAIVELGFRSSDYSIRADAFLCWKVLVEIFAKHNEIFSPKRIKLISIPLKSSQSKTLETSVNKFKVWWYFLCKLAPKIEDYLDIYESFLIYCFGPSCKQQSNAANASAVIGGQGKMYLKVKQMAIACLIESLGQSTKENASVLNSMGLEHLPYPLVTKGVMAKCGSMILNACFESTLMACDPEHFGKQIETLWKNFNARLVESQNIDIYCEFFKQLVLFIEAEEFETNYVLRQMFVKIIDLMTTSKTIPFGSEDSINATKLSDGLVRFLQVLMNTQLTLPSHTVSNISELCKLSSLINSPKYWAVQKNLMPLILTNGNADDNLKWALWRNISLSLVDYLKYNIFEFRIAENAKLVNEWIMWPLQNTVAQAAFTSGNDFLSNWRSLIEAASNAQGRTLFTEQVTPMLRTFYERDSFNEHFAAALETFILTMDNNFDMSSKPTSAFELINQVLSNANKSSKGSYTNIVEALTTFISKLQEKQVIDAFSELKTICATIVDKENSGVYTKHSIDNFKRAFQDKLKSNKAKEKKLLKEIKDIIKNDSPYVIIPTVWSMNPDKLTEHQKEKMKEKRSDIPALYNDISQSQDSSIKPWTPKKIVIAKSRDSAGEIVIENNLEYCDPSIQLSDEEPAIVHPISNHVESIKGDNRTTLNSCDQNKGPNQEASHTKKEEDESLKKGKLKSKNRKKKECVVSDESKKILNKLNIDADEKNTTLLRQLKSIEIDTVEGNIVVQRRFRERRSMGTKGENTNEKGKTQNGTGQTAIEMKKKRGENNRKRKSLVFESEKTENVKDVSDDNTKTSSAQENLLNGNTKPVGEINESADEIIEASQTSESLLSKKVATRKSFASTTINNNIFIRPVSKNHDEDKIIEVVKSTSLSPQKENSSPNVEETIAETPTSVDAPSAIVETEKTKPMEQPQEQLNHRDMYEADTEPNTELLNTSLNGQFLKPFDISSTPRESLWSKLPLLMPNMNTAPKNSISNPSVQIQNVLLLNSTNGPATEETSVSEVETEPNTEIEFNTSKKVDEGAALERSNESKTGEQANHENLNNSTELNCSIRSSPECKDVEERNSEFLNNTLNISPILNGDNKDMSSERRCGIENDKTPSSPVGRKLIKPGLQLPISPPERKSTNNTESPATRHKPLPPFSGRGAQLIYLIHNKRTESTPKPQTMLQMNARTDEKSTVSPSALQTQQQLTPQQSASPPKKEQPVTSTPQSMGPQNMQVPMQKDLLVFSKVLPSPSASPSASILKRKIHRDSLDDIESPMSKRKRVSFHDPPVSVTKEYMKYSEEDSVKPGLNRCLLPDRTSTPNNTYNKNNSLKRKSRADSILEIANFSNNGEQASGSANSSGNQSIGQTSAEMESLKWNKTSNENDQSEVDERCLTPSPSLYFANDDAALKHVMEKYPIETLLEKYMESDKVLPNKSIRSIANKLCTVMKQDAKAKINVLEVLSEQHPREFLDHAIQENLSFVVCERLSFSSIVEFVSEKSKLNETCRGTLLERIQSLLSADKLNADAQQLMMELLKNHRMSDQDIIGCMKVIVDRHQANQQNQN